jgi:hypothetical protein
MNTFVQVLVKHGYSALFASVFACQLALPVPAILFLMAAGVLAGSGQLSLGVTLGLAVIACLLADLLWYEAGRRWGNQILHFIYGLAADPHAAVRQAKRNFHRHGSRTLILAKFVVGLDAAAPPLAGLSGTGRFRFLGLMRLEPPSGPAHTRDSVMCSAETWIARFPTYPVWARLSPPFWRPESLSTLVTSLFGEFVRYANFEERG